jgi:replicative DNA helicase
MLLSAESLAEVVATLRADDFYTPAHSLIFDAIVSLYSAGSPVDAVTVVSALQEAGNLRKIGGGEYVHDIIKDVPSAASGSYYARIVRDKATLRGVAVAAIRAFEEAHSGGESADQVVERAQAAMLAVSEIRSGTEYVPVVDAVLAAVDEIQNAAHPDSTKALSTGIPDLDTLVGGFYPGQMVVVAARPGVGKSTFALDVARQAAIHRGLPTLYFSLEMTQSELTKRIIAAECNVPLVGLHHGGLSDDQVATVGERAKAVVANAPLFLDDSPHLTLGEIRAKCRRLKHDKGVALIVVDYLQLLGSSRSYETRQQEVADFSRSLKLLAKEMGATVIAVSQLNRGAESRASRTPVLSDLRDSGAIEQDADVVILLHREELHDKGSRPGEVDMIVAKNRSGPTGAIVAAARLEVGRIDPIPQG